MVLERLGESLKNSLGKITKAMFVDEKLIDEIVRDIQRALLTGDVNVQLVFEITKNIKQRAVKEEPPSGITKKEQLIKIVYDELVKFLGEKEHKIEIKKKPTKIMLVGLFGNGKTTAAGKLGKYFLKRGNKVCLLGLDVWRPAAFDQLFQLGAQINVPVFGNKKEKNPEKIYREFESEIKKFDVVIVDTAGRDALSKELIDELNKINNLVDPDYTFLVMGADVGQAAQEQAKKFHETVNVNGVIITKMDGTAKGGGALSACAVTKAPVVFLGVGEKIDDLEPFIPERFVSRLLGMGDIQTLLEKAKEIIPQEKAEDLGKKFLKGEFTLIDLHEQMQQMKKMGPLTKVMEMIPGMGQLKLPKEMLQTQEGKLEKWKYIMNSCTQEELENPEIMNATRVERIANGAGVEVSDVREMLKQYKQSKKMVKMFSGKGAGNVKQMQQMMKKMGGAKGMKF